MKRSLICLGCLIGLLMLPAFSYADNLDHVDWDAFSKNLATAMKSDNPGLQQSAMCMMIQYGDNLNIKRDTVFDIVRIFRSDENKNVRLLAMIALYKIEDPWGMDYLKRHNRFESEKRIQTLCCCAVNTYYAKMDSLKHPSETVLVQAEQKVVEDFYTQATETIQLDEFGF